MSKYQFCFVTDLYNCVHSCSVALSFRIKYLIFFRLIPLRDLSPDELHNKRKPSTSFHASTLMPVGVSLTIVHSRYYSFEEGIWPKPRLIPDMIDSCHNYHVCVEHTLEKLVMHYHDYILILLLQI